MRVYHFIPEQYGLEGLHRRRLKISRLGDLNDPFELLPAALPTPSHRKALKHFADHANARWGVICFSRTWHDPLLWSHYADRHRGLCLGFEVPRVKLAAVEYVSGRIVLDIDRQLMKSTQDPAFGLKLMTTKYEPWSYEDEVRTFCALDDLDIGTGLYFKPFDAFLHLRQVIVGVRSSLTRQELSSAISEDDGPVQLMKARLAFNTYWVVPQRNRNLW